MARISFGEADYYMSKTVRLPYVDVVLEAVPTTPAGNVYTSYADWKMYLERQDWKSGSRDGWSVIDSRTGWVDSKSISRRTFSNIKTTGQPLRVRAVLTKGNNSKTIIA